MNEPIELPAVAYIKQRSGLKPASRRAVNINSDEKGIIVAASNVPKNKPI